MRLKDLAADNSGKHLGPGSDDHIHMHDKATSRVPVHGVRGTPADTAWEVGRGSLAPSSDSVAQRQMGKTFINPGKTGTDGNAEMGWDRSDTLGYGASPKHGAMSCILVV